MLYSKDGSIPYPYTDGTEGWIEVPDAPTPPEGMEVVWWFPPGWVIRPPKPESIDGYVWKWSQTDEQWNSYFVGFPPPPEPVTQVVVEETTTIPSSNEPVLELSAGADSNGADSLPGGV
jgi:hypothetical protein